MIKIIKGNLFDTSAPIIAHQVNCKGVMGSGVAKQVKEKYPLVFSAYKNYCQENDNLLGKVLLVDSSGNERLIEENRPYIANLFGQDNYGYDGKQYTNIEAFKEACVSLYIKAQMLGVNTIAMPYKIGSDRGGASWSQVYMILESLFNKIDLELWKLEE